jgi:hypothetical protein
MASDVMRGTDAVRRAGDPGVIESMNEAKARRRAPLARFARLAACALLALAPATPRAAPADSASTAAPDFSGYQQLLNDFVTVISARREPVDTRFDYERLYDVKGRYERLSRIRKQLFGVPPSRMDDRTRLAWAINAYNFLVIESATGNLLISARLQRPGNRQRYLSVRDIRLPEAPHAFFQSPVVELEGERYSLDAFERRFLLAGFDRAAGGAPPAGLDPRVHFAVVCGALGCPPLLPRAYRPDSLELQLDFATRNALALPRHLRIDESMGRIQVSSIFGWYAADFGGPGKAFEFVMAHAPPGIAKAVARARITSLSVVLPWDWELNQTVRKRTI